MEAIALTMEGELNCFSEMFTNEEADFMAQLLGPNSGFGASTDSNNTTNLYNLSSNYSISGGGGFLNPSSSLESYYLMSESDNPGLINTTNGSISFDFSIDDHAKTASYLVEGNEYYPNQEMITSGDVEEFGRQNPAEGKTSEVSNKRPRGVDNVEKTKRNVRSKKNQKVAASSSSNNEEECNDGLKGVVASSSCCSEDDSNQSLNLNGKTRASRGAATDPQSLYARKRRERINERLRILQNLVPNGTKVDISTMLEEAVHYVKFLQLQIKLLSSDDLWMYAPLAYNGMDLGLDLKLITASQ